MTAPAVAIVGAGPGGFQVAASLREMQFDGRIVLVGDEPYTPYHRPPLSKAYLLGSMDESRLAMRPDAFYKDRLIEIRTGRRAVAIDRKHCKVALDDDSVVDYDHLVLAAGARNRPLPIPGCDLSGVLFLRTLDEARALKTYLGRVRKAVVIGAGFIGLELTSAARSLGVDVTVIEVADRPMARALSAEMSNVFAREHAKTGVKLRFGTQVMRLTGKAGQVTGVETVEGEIIEAEVVVIGIGVIPNVELAATCDLDVSNGIIVDEHLSTADPHISAVGDCAVHPNSFTAGRVRIESIQNAADQGRCVASRIAGKGSRFSAVPWFWSDQGDLKLQIAGLVQGYDRAVVRGDLAGTSCSVFCYRGDRLLAAETLNRPADHMAARRIIGNRLALSCEQAVDESFNLRDFAASATRPVAAVAS